MALPKQVQAALDAADATLAGVNGQTAQTQPDAGNPAPEVPLVPEPALQAPLRAVAPEPPAPTRQADDVWEARYKSLQGLFNKEVPSLQHQVKTLQTDLAAAVERLNRASEQKEVAPEPQRAMDPKDIDSFGEDLVDMVQRVSTSVMGQVTRAFEAKFTQFDSAIAELQRTVQGTTQQVAISAEQAFFERVTKLVPAWEQTNADPGFLAWLAEVDPVYGLPRQAALERAQRELNPDRAAAVFQAYLGPKQAAPKAPDPLDRQISPKGASTVAPTPTEKPVLTQRQITAFYDDVRRGMYRGKEAEAAQIEQVINAALSEGRVR